MKRTYLFLLGLTLALALAGCSTSKTGQFQRPDPTDTLPPSEALSAAITQPAETEATSDNADTLEPIRVFPSSDELWEMYLKAANI